VRYDGCVHGVGGCLLAKLASSGVLCAGEPVLEASMEKAGKPDIRAMKTT
jgi:hypothetical protein